MDVLQNYLFHIFPQTLALPGVKGSRVFLSDKQCSAHLDLAFAAPRYFDFLEANVFLTVETKRFHHLGHVSPSRLIVSNCDYYSNWECHVMPMGFIRLNAGCIDRFVNSAWIMSYGSLVCHDPTCAG